MTMHTIDTTDIYTELTINNTILSEEEKKGLYLELTNSKYWQDIADAVLTKLNKHVSYHPVKVFLEGWRRVRSERASYCCVMDSLVQLIVLRAWYLREAQDLKAFYMASENTLSVLADKVFDLQDAYDVAVDMMTTGGVTVSEKVVHNLTMCIGKLMNKLHVMHKDVLVKAYDEAVVIIKGYVDGAF